MALTDQWTRAQIRAVVRRELLDPKEKWWPDAELDKYISEWQNVIQEGCEMVWGDSTSTVSSGTLTLTALATDILRLDAIYWNDKRLVGRSKEELDFINRDWRDQPTGTPRIVYQDNEATLSFYPAPDVAGTLVLEYPKILSFATDSSTMSLPAWTRYSAKDYCLYRAFSRFGPNQDQNVAARFKKRFDKKYRIYKSIVANFFPHKFPTLRPGTTYEKEILQPEFPERTISQYV